METQDVSPMDTEGNFLQGTSGMILKTVKSDQLMVQMSIYVEKSKLNVLNTFQTKQFPIYSDIKHLRALSSCLSIVPRPLLLNAISHLLLDLMSSKWAFFDSQLCKNITTHLVFGWNLFLNLLPSNQVHSGWWTNDLLGDQGLHAFGASTAHLNVLDSITYPACSCHMKNRVSRVISLQKKMVYYGLSTNLLCPKIDIHAASGDYCHHAQNQLRKKKMKYCIVLRQMKT